MPCPLMEQMSEGVTKWGECEVHFKGLPSNAPSETPGKWRRIRQELGHLLQTPGTLFRSKPAPSG